MLYHWREEARTRRYVIFSCVEEETTGAVRALSFVDDITWWWQEEIQMKLRPSCKKRQMQVFRWALGREKCSYF